MFSIRESTLALNKHEIVEADGTSIKGCPGRLNELLG